MTDSDRDRPPPAPPADTDPVCGPPVEPAGAPPLAYHEPSTGPGSPSLPAFNQAALGFMTWIAALGVGGLLCVRFKPADLRSTLIVVGGCASLAIGAGVWARVHLRWKGFLPGLLIGFGLTCLVPIGIVAVVCGASGK